MDAGNDNLILIDELNACQRTITPQIRALSPHSSQITVRAGLKALGAVSYTHLTLPTICSV